MQIFKSFLLAGSLAVATSPVCLRADDTEAQAMARAALQQKMREMSGQAPVAVTPPENTPPASKIQETTPPETQPPPVQKQTPRPVLVPAPRRSSPGQPPIVLPANAPAPMDSAKAPGTPPASSSATLVAPQTSNPDLIEQARQAARAKMAELEGQRNNTAPVEPQAATQPVVQPAPAPMDSAKAPGTPQASPSVKMVAPETSNPDLIEQARQATRAKLAELEGQRSNTTPVEPPATPQPVFQPAPVTVPPATTATQPVAAEVKPAGPSKEEIRAAKEREAAEMKAAREQVNMEKTAAKKAAAEKDAAEKAAAKQAKTATKAKPEAPAPFTPLAAPPSSLPASKEQRLQTLLDQYKADKITAEEYHDQRAKIIAEP